MGSIANKYRVHEVAKDFGVSTKEITEILTKYAETPKNHMQVLEDRELSLIFEYLTQHNPVSSIAVIFAEGAKPDFAALADPEAQEVVRLIEQFPLILKSALERSEPSMITRFSADLAQAFNKFYYERRILDEDMGARAARLLLTRVSKNVIRVALSLIGLAAPERM